MTRSLLSGSFHAVREKVQLIDHTLAVQSPIASPPRRLKTRAQLQNDDPFSKFMREQNGGAEGEGARAAGSGAASSAVTAKPSAKKKEEMVRWRSKKRFLTRRCCYFCPSWAHHVRVRIAACLRVFLEWNSATCLLVCNCWCFVILLCVVALGECF